MVEWWNTKSNGQIPTGPDFYDGIREAVLIALTVQNLLDALDLSAATRDIPLLHALEDLTIESVTILWTEASSADAGVVIRVGKESDDDFFYTGDSETDQAKWNESSLTLLETDLDEGDTLTIGTVGGKTGTGEVALIIRYRTR